MNDGVRSEVLKITAKSYRLSLEAQFTPGRREAVDVERIPDGHVRGCGEIFIRSDGGDLQRALAVAGPEVNLCGHIVNAYASDVAANGLGDQRDLRTRYIAHNFDHASNWRRANAADIYRTRAVIELSAEDVVGAQRSFGFGRDIAARELRAVQEDNAVGQALHFQAQRSSPQPVAAKRCQ